MMISYPLTSEWNKYFCTVWTPASARWSSLWNKLQGVRLSLPLRYATIQVVGCTIRSCIASISFKAEKFTAGWRLMTFMASIIVGKCLKMSGRHCPASNCSAFSLRWCYMRLHPDCIKSFTDVSSCCADVLFSPQMILALGTSWSAWYILGWCWLEESFFRRIQTTQEHRSWWAKHS